VRVQSIACSTGDAPGRRGALIKRGAVVTGGSRGVGPAIVDRLCAEGSDAIYNASKAFVEALIRSIAIEHGPRVRCNDVSPGRIESDMVDHGFARARNSDAARSDALARRPFEKRGHHPTDIADTVSWLTSEEARYVTGQVFTVDGAMTDASPISSGLFR
jgi:meso-butanediol dehydrogenase/(S,S)-butanediol dehydrogenase/diacetyl reductase